MAVPAAEHVVAWRPPIAGVREVLHATPTSAHEYPRHAHDTWTLFIVDRGARSGTTSLAGTSGSRRRPDWCLLLPPHVAHDGRSALEQTGYRMRVLYVEPSVIPEALTGAAVDRPVHRRPDVSGTRLRRA